MHIARRISTKTPAAADISYGRQNCLITKSLEKGYYYKKNGRKKNRKRHRILNILLCILRESKLLENLHLFFKLTEPLTFEKGENTIRPCVQVKK